MGTRGPQSGAPGGYGTITPKGHRRIYHGGRYRMEHVVVWEKHHGPVPVGQCVHHLNGDPLDNRIENLQVVDPTTHKRIHSGCELRNGTWWKPCRKCGRIQPETEYYQRRTGIGSWCKTCTIYEAVQNKRRRRKGK